MSMLDCPNDFHEENRSFSAFKKKTGYRTSDGRTDGPTDIPAYRDARTHLKKHYKKQNKKPSKTNLTLVFVDASFSLLSVSVGTRAPVGSRQIDAAVLAGVASGQALVQVRTGASVRRQGKPDRTRAQVASVRIPARELARRRTAGAFVDVQALSARPIRFVTLLAAAAVNIENEWR